VVLAQDSAVVEAAVRCSWSMPAHFHTAGPAYLSYFRIRGVCRDRPVEDAAIRLLSHCVEARFLPELGDNTQRRDVAERSHFG
jgi:hypothetical protein